MRNILTAVIFLLFKKRIGIKSLYQIFLIYEKVKKEKVTEPNINPAFI